MIRVFSGSRTFDQTNHGNRLATDKPGVHVSRQDVGGMGSGQHTAEHAAVVEMSGETSAPLNAGYPVRGRELRWQHPRPLRRELRLA